MNRRFADRCYQGTSSYIRVIRLRYRGQVQCFCGVWGKVRLNRPVRLIRAALVSRSQASRGNGLGADFCGPRGDRYSNRVSVSGVSGWSNARRLPCKSCNGSKRTDRFKIVYRITWKLSGSWCLERSLKRLGLYAYYG